MTSVRRSFTPELFKYVCAILNQGGSLDFGPLEQYDNTITTFYNIHHELEMLLKGLDNNLPQYVKKKSKTSLEITKCDRFYVVDVRAGFIMNNSKLQSMTITDMLRLSMRREKVVANIPSLSGMSWCHGQQAPCEESTQMLFDEVPQASSSSPDNEPFHVRLVSDAKKYISAFANNTGGCVIFGVDEIGICQGYPKPEPKEVEQLRDCLQEGLSKMYPILTPDDVRLIVVPTQCDNFVVYVIEVKPSDKIIFTSHPFAYAIEDEKLVEIGHPEWLNKVKSFDPSAQPQQQSFKLHPHSNGTITVSILPAPATNLQTHQEPPLQQPLQPQQWPPQQPQQPHQQQHMSPLLRFITSLLQQSPGLTNQEIKKRANQAKVSDVPTINKVLHDNKDKFRYEPDGTNKRWFLV